MCNATTKHGSKCKRPNSFGDFCHYHRYLDDDFQPGAIENIKPSVNYSQYTIDTCTSHLESRLIIYLVGLKFLAELLDYLNN